MVVLAVVVVDGVVMVAEAVATVTKEAMLTLIVAEFLVRGVVTAVVGAAVVVVVVVLAVVLAVVIAVVGSVVIRVTGVSLTGLETHSVVVVRR